MFFKRVWISSVTKKNIFELYNAQTLHKLLKMYTSIMTNLCLIFHTSNVWISQGLSMFYDKYHVHKIFPKFFKLNLVSISQNPTVL